MPGERLNPLAKSLAVLEAVVDQPQAVGLPDLATKLGMPRQTVHRLLTQLVKQGLLMRSPRERYSIGPRLSKLAFASLQSRNREAAVRLILQELVDDTRETCNLGVLDGLDYLYLERIECEWPLRIHLEAGSRTPAHCVAGGKVLLAHLESSERKRLLKGRKLQARTSRTVTRVSDLETELAKVRTAGCSINDQENFDGIVAAAVPVKDARGLVVAALTVHGPLPRLTLEACAGHVPRLRQAAERIARAWDIA
jgi:IclR family transcriptional regulator, acetate operon repressor